MESLAKVCEGILDTDFDVQLPEIKDHSKFSELLSKIGTPTQRNKCNIWQGYEVAELLTQIMCKCIGSKVNKRDARNAACNQCLLAMCKSQSFKESGISSCMRIGNDKQGVEIQTCVIDGKPVTRVLKLSWLSRKIDDFAWANWNCRVAPEVYTKVIMDALHYEKLG